MVIPSACQYLCSFSLSHQHTTADYNRPILTYQMQGAKKHGVNQEDHAIIYTEKIRSEEINRDEGMTKRAIEMVPRTHRDKLEPKSRINYAKIYTVEHNCKVLFIGQITKGSEGPFMRDFDDTWNKKRQISSASWSTY